MDTEFHRDLKQEWRREKPLNQIFFVTNYTNLTNHLKPKELKVLLSLCKTHSFPLCNSEAKIFYLNSCLFVRFVTKKGFCSLAKNSIISYISPNKFPENKKGHRPFYTTSFNSFSSISASSQASIADIISSSIFSSSSWVSISLSRSFALPTFS